MVVLVCVDTFNRILLLEVVVDEQLEDLNINRDLRQPNEYAPCDLGQLHLIKPLVLSYVSDLESLLGIRVKDGLEELSRVTSHKLRDRVLATKDLLVKVGCVWVFEREVTAYHGEEDDTAAPYVDVGPEVALASYHLRSCIARGSACGFEGLSGLVGVGEAEINDLDVFLMIEKQILGLEISMNNTQLMKVLDASDYLMEEAASLRLLDSLALNDVVKELSSACVLHDQIELLRSLDDLVELDDVRMADELEDVDLSGNPLYIAHILDFLLLKNFNSNFLAREVVASELHFAESALANGLAYEELRETRAY